MTYSTRNTLYASLGVLVAAGILLLDKAASLGAVDSVLYISIVLIAFFTKNKKFIYVGAITGTLLTISDFFMSPLSGELWQLIANHSLIIFTIWMIATLCILQHSYSEKMRVVHDDLEKMKMKKNVELIHYAITNNLLDN